MENTRRISSLPPPSSTESVGTARQSLKEALETHARTGDFPPRPYESNEDPNHRWSSSTQASSYSTPKTTRLARLYSLGNIIILSNVLLIALAAGVIAVVAYVTFVSAIQSVTAVIASELSLKTVNVLRLGLIDSAVSTADLSVAANNFGFLDFSNYTIIEHYVEAQFLSTNSDNGFDTLALVRLPGLYVSVGQLSFYERNLIGAIAHNDGIVQAYLVNTSCPVYNLSCDIFDPTTVYLNESLLGIEGTLVSALRGATEPAWSAMHLLPETGDLAITYVSPASTSNKNLTFFAASSISLTTLSYALAAANPVVVDSAGTRVFIVQRKGNAEECTRLNQNGALLATSLQIDVVVLSCIIEPSESSDAMIVQISNFINSQLGPWATLNVSADGTSLTMSGLVISIRPFVVRPSTGGYHIDWFVVSAYSQESLLSGVDTTYQIIVPVVAIAIAILAVIVSVIITRQITRSLVRVSKKLESVTKLNFEGRPKHARRLDFTEVRRINDVIDDMTKNLRSFMRYVPPDVVQLLVVSHREAHLEAVEVELSIFFSDIANFTKITESMRSEELVGFLGDYLTEMSTCIQSNLGLVDKFLGDSVMAFWNAPVPVVDHAKAACRTALQVRQRVALLREKWLQCGYELRHRVGINTGKAWVGNLGSPTRFNFTCIGDSVNLASRLEGLGKAYGTEIQISEFTYEQVKDAYLCRPLDLICVKGKEKPVFVYELLEDARMAPASAIREAVTYHSAMNHYRERQFDEALPMFETYLESYPQDKSARTKIQQCRHYIQNSPPDDWMGIEKMEDK